MYLASRRGDYLRGYRGDPGLFGTLGKIVGGAAKLGGSIIPGPAGTLLRGVGTALSGGSRPTAMQVQPPRAQTTFAGIRAGGPYGLSAGVERYQGVRGSVSVPVGAMGECPKGYRPNKSGYFTKSEGWVAPGSKCVRYRYMEVTNGRALRRAIRRTKRFDKLVKDNRKALKSLASI